MQSNMKNSHKLQTTHHGDYLTDMFEYELLKWFLLKWHTILAFTKKMDFTDVKSLRVSATYIM